MEDLRRILSEAMEECRKEILKAYSSNAPIEKTTGKTGAGLEIIQPADNHIQLWGYDYTGVLDTGRRGGKVPKGFYRIIREWAVAKGLTFASQTALNTFAYFTAKKIAEKGTKLFREGGRTDILQEPTERLLQRVEEKISEALLKVEFFKGF